MSLLDIPQADFKQDFAIISVLEPMPEQAELTVLAQKITYLLVEKLVEISPLVATTHLLDSALAVVIPLEIKILLLDSMPVDLTLLVRVTLLLDSALDIVPLPAKRMYSLGH
jgi:hypothetical protein